MIESCNQLTYLDKITKINKLSNLTSDLEEKVLILEKLKREIEQINKVLLESGLSDFGCIGKPPDHITELPLSSEKDVGLDLECMLKKMHEIATGDLMFHITTNNCSTTSIKVLAAGMIDPKFTHIRVALGKIDEQLMSPLSVKHASEDIYNQKSRGILRTLQRISRKHLMIISKLANEKVADDKHTPQHT